MNRFSKYSWAVLIWNILVILWGAIVRASGSGAGCGSHWPTCNGQILPGFEKTQTLIEFIHRMMSGTALILVLIMLIWGLRKYKKGHHQRIGVIGSAVLIIIEALLGAGLVLFKLVANDSSIYRAIAVSIHLLNTFILLAFLSLNAWWASGGHALNVKKQRSILLFYILGLIGIAAVGMSGAITALGDTLFPSTSLAHTLQEQSNPEAHFLIQLRILHPIIAVMIGTYILYFLKSLHRQISDPNGKKITILVAILVIIQWTAGVINVILLAPYWMQVVHLFIADTVWISYILSGAFIFSQSPSEVL